MKVFNLTDILGDKGGKPYLLVIGRHFIAPGMSAEVEDTPVNRQAAERLAKKGLVAIERLPLEYRQNKARRK